MSSTMNKKGATMERISIDTSAIPEPNAERLACSALAAVKRCLAQPGGKERLEKSAELYYKRKAEKNAGEGR